MKRTSTFGLLAVLLLGALAAPDASAQRRYRPRYQEPARSNTQGFFLEGSLGATSVRVDTDDDEGEDQSGGALGVRLGYGFNRRVALYAAVGGAAIEPDDDAFEFATGSDTYGLGNIDLGLEVNLGRPASPLVPYLNAALSGVAATIESEDTDDELSLSGGGLTLGGGLKYHFAPAFALNGSLQFYGGEFNRIELNGEDFDLDDVTYQGARLGLGLTWYPGR